MLIGVAVAGFCVPLISGWDRHTQYSTMLIGAPLAARPRVAFMSPLSSASSARPSFAADAISRAKKVEQIEGMRTTAEKHDFLAIAENGGMTATELTKFREAVKEAGGNYQIMKATLARIAVNGTRNEAISEYVSGPMGIIYSDDPVNVAKATLGYIKVVNPKPDKKSKEPVKPKLTLKGGVLNGVLLTPEKIVDLSKMPSLEDSIAQLTGNLKAPSTNLAMTIKGVSGKLARTLKALAEKKAEEEGR